MKKSLLLSALAPLLLFGKGWYAEIKPCYFYPTSHTMKEIFNNGGGSVRGEIGYFFNKTIAAWLDGGYFQETGKAIHADYNVDIRLGSLTLGLKAFGWIQDWCALYAGVGPRAFFLRLHNHSPYVDPYNNKNLIGTGLTGGVWFLPGSNRNVIIDFFLDLSIGNAHFSHSSKGSEMHNVLVNGLSIGAGLGYKF